MTSNSALPPNHCLDAIAVKLAQEDLAPGKSVSGQPRVGTLTLGQIGAHSVGIWEISPSVSTDVERGCGVDGGGGSIAIEDQSVGRDVDDSAFAITRSSAGDFASRVQRETVRGNVDRPRITGGKSA